MREAEDVQTAPGSRGDGSCFFSTPRLLDSSTTLDLLAALIDNSLVQRAEVVAGEPRFAMLGDDP